MSCGREGKYFGNTETMVTEAWVISNDIRRVKCNVQSLGRSCWFPECAVKRYRTGECPDEAI
jgi:hypothetical protein